MRRVVWVGTILATACAPGSDGPSPTVTRNELVAREFVVAWESGDADAITDLFRPDAVYDDFPNQMQYSGIQEIVGYLGAVQQWATGLNVTAAAVHASETGAAVEWVFSAIQERPIGTLMPTATGNEVVLNGATILEIENGRVSRAADYMDALALVLQLGGQVRMPGGGTIRLDDLVRADTTGGREP